MLKTYIVTPDFQGGGIEWEVIVVANNPLQACALVAKYLELDDGLIGFEPDFSSSQRGYDSWHVQQLPKLLHTIGVAQVVEWSDFVTTRWKAHRAEED